MAGDQDRYAVLREAHQSITKRETEDKRDLPVNATQQAVDQEHRSREIGSKAAEKQEQYVPHAGGKHGWDWKQDRPSQEKSAWTWVRAGHEHRMQAFRETNVEPPKVDQPSEKDAPQKEERKLSFFEDRKPHRPNHDVLKREQAERTLSFYEDRNPDQDRSRTR